MALGHFQAFLAAGAIPWREVTALDIEAWQASMLRAGRSPGAVSRMSSIICGLYAWAHGHGVLPTDPGATVRRPPRPRRTTHQALDVAQARQVLAASTRLGRLPGLAVHLMLLNGLRRGDLLIASASDIRVQGELVILRLPRRKGGVLSEVALPQATVDLLPHTLRGRLIPWTERQLYLALDQVAAEAGLDRLRPHMLRVTFVTLALDAGAPPRDVMASAGHAHLTTTAHYDAGYASVRRNVSGRLAALLTGDAEKPPHPA